MDIVTRGDLTISPKLPVGSDVAVNESTVERPRRPSGFQRRRILENWSRIPYDRNEHLAVDGLVGSLERGDGVYAPVAGQLFADGRVVVPRLRPFGRILRPRVLR
jgi:hypothetical protein